MTLREWLQELGAHDTSGATLKNVNRIIFSADAYVIEMMDGRKYQDNDLDRLLAVIRDEFDVHNTTVLLKGRGDALYPIVDYPFVAGKQVMTMRPGAWTAAIPAPSVEAMVQQMAQNITFFNLTGSFRPPMKKENL